MRAPPGDGVAVQQIEAVGVDVEQPVAAEREALFGAHVGPGEDAADGALCEGQLWPTRDRGSAS